VHFEITVAEAKDRENRGTASTLMPNAVDSTKSVEITKTGSTRKIVSTTRQGIVKVYWILDGFIFTMSPDGKQVNRDLYDVAFFPAYLRPGGRDFYGMEGVALEHYQGVSSLNGKPCYFYKRRVSATPESRSKGAERANTSAGGDQVWIDVNTKLPVAAVLPEGLCIYTFLPSPQAPLDPPPAFVKLSEYMKAMTLRMQQEASVR